MASSKPEISFVDTTNLEPVPASQVQRRKRFSTYLITVNPNLAAKNTADAVEKAEILRGIVNSIFNNAEGLERATKIEGGAFDSDTISDIDVQMAIELGSKQHRIHTHVRVNYEHYAKNIKMNIPYLREKISTEFGRKVHINVRGVQTDQSLQEYIRKRMQRAEAAATTS